MKKHLTLLALLGLATCVPAYAALELSAPVRATDHTHRPLVHQIVCSKGKGTAFRIGPTTFISVTHVTDNEGCTIDGAKFTTRIDPGLDFAVLDVPTRRGGAFKINCDGFRSGEYYFAVGYAKGNPWQQTVVLYSYGQVVEGYALLWGNPTVIPGMSGGPILNSRGEVVGTVNMYNPWKPWSFSRALADTSLCAKGKPVNFS